MEPEPRNAQERALLLLRATLNLAWLPTSRFQRLVWTVRIVILVGILVLIGSSYNKTLWDWLQLLIVPAVIAAGGVWFNRQQQERGLEVENQRAQDEAFQAYLDQMSQMMVDNDRPLRSSQPEDTLSLVAQARTRTVLRRLDPQRKRFVVQFLSDAELIQSSGIDHLMERMKEKKDDPAERDSIPPDLIANVTNPSHQIVVSLEEADLSGTDLRGLHLANVDLYKADLRRANLSNIVLWNAKLNNAKLSGATLQGTKLSGADLNSASLNNADLSGAALHNAKLSKADLQHAILRGAMLGGADMTKANLQGADLTGVKLTPDDLTEANMFEAKGITDRTHDEMVMFVVTTTLAGATMPNGQPYEEWIKDSEYRRYVEAPNFEEEFRELNTRLRKWNQELEALREDEENTGPS